MKKFWFRARNWDGKRVENVVEAQDLRAARKLIGEQGLVLTKIYEKKESEFHKFITKFVGRASLKQVVNFTRQLSTMLVSGLALTDALSLLRDQVKPGTVMYMVIDDALGRVQQGQSFAAALSVHKKVFGEAYVATVEAGEKGGVLEEVLLKLADNWESKQEFMGKLKGAMIYPVIVVVGMLGVMLVMILVVIPKLTQMYTDFGGQMPLPTRILMAISSLALRVWFLLPFLPFLFFFLFRFSKKIPGFEKKWDKLGFKVPIMGKLREKGLLAEAHRTLSMLLGAGVSLIESLQVVGKATGSVVYGEAFQKASEKVEKGFSLAEALEETGVFPVIVYQMAATGEETGKLDEVMIKVSHYFASEAEQAVKGLTSAIEPLIMLVLGLGVGFLVIAVVMPIYNLTSQF